MSYWEAIGQSNDWYTPPEIFEALGETFDLDVAAPNDGPWHVPTSRWLSSNSLEREWDGFIWMNPPFEGRNGIAPWLDKFFDHGNGIAVSPDRTSAPWFQSAWRRGSFVLFTKKIKFIRPCGNRGASPSNGTALWAAGSRAEEALRRADERGFGILAQCDGRQMAEMRSSSGRSPTSAVAESDAPNHDGAS
jgi:hypothetical protein